METEEILNVNARLIETIISFIKTNESLLATNEELKSLVNKLEGVIFSLLASIDRIQGLGEK